MVNVLDYLFGVVPNAMLVAVVAGLIRNILGWLINAIQDGEITAYEIKQLIETLVKYIQYVLMFSLGMPVEQAAIAAFSLDVVKSTYEKYKVQENTNVEKG